MKAVVLQNLVKKYRQVTAVDNISIAIEGEQIFGFWDRTARGRAAFFKSCAESCQQLPEKYRF